MDEKLSINNVKGTVHQIINFRINLIFWVVMAIFYNQNVCSAGASENGGLQ